ncbi:kinase-like domain-containing protein [Mycena galericulata]|nr:kinase-like domain-containing protein [Mycena galericulata]
MSSQPTEAAFLDEFEVDSHLWGYLEPLSLNPKVLRIDLWRITPSCTLGRDPSSNALILPGKHISGNHAVMTWNRRSGRHSIINIRDLSSGGTWVSGRLVGHGKSQTLRSGDEIGLGAPVAVEDEDGLYDYRYIFHDVAGRPPFRIDDYYIKDIPLGRGTFGTVDRAFRKGTIPQKVVAIKTLLYYWQPASDPLIVADALERNFEEIRALENIQHPHVIQIFAAHHGDTTPVIHLILEYMPGGNLFDYMVREGERQTKARAQEKDRDFHLGIPENICREIMYQLCHAMAYVHCIGITHRDLKPENILLTDTGDDGRPFIKVADFGLAKIEKDLDKPALMSSVCGSFEYAAPEVLDPRSRGYDHYADSFSAGVIMFMLLILGNPWFPARKPPYTTLPKLRWDLLTVEMLAPEGHDLLDHLVQPDPHKRVSLAGALGHLWMKAHQPMHPDLQYPLVFE